MEEEMKQLPPEAHELIAKLLQQSYSDYMATTARLIENLQHENAFLRAEIGLMRANICSVLDAPFVPNPSHVRTLLWPSREEILDRVEEENSAA